MRGEITSASSFLVDLECSGSGKLARDDRRELLERVFQAVVDNHVGELGLRGELPLGYLQTALDLLRVVGSAPDQASAQRVQRGRRDEDLDRIGHRLAHLAGTLDLDLQNHGSASRRASLARIVEPALLEL